MCNRIFIAFFLIRGLKLLYIIDIPQRYFGAVNSPQFLSVLSTTLTGLPADPRHVLRLVDVYVPEC